MGWMCSWVAVQGAAKDDVLGALGLAETSSSVEPGSREADFSYAERRGWVVVFSEDFEWGDEALAAELSRLGLVVGCQFEDKVEMASSAFAAREGQILWRVSHVNESGGKLEVRGEPPAEFPAIRDRLSREQEAHGEEADFLFDVPIEIAKAACGYRADEDEGMFIALIGRRGAGAAPRASARPAGGGGFLSRFFASLGRPKR